MHSVLNKKLIFLFSFICAITVGNLYLIQPLLAEVSEYFQVSAASIGIVATLAQVGYGLGVLFIVPLGDLVERRFLMLALLAGVTLALLFAGFAPSVSVLCLASLLVGLTTVVPQVVIPYAASLAKPSERAYVIGTVQSGLLIGILLARTVAGSIASLSSWRWVYFVAAGLALMISVVVWVFFPRQEVNARLPYSRLLASLWELFVELKGLRRVSIASAFNFAAFSVFWTTLSFLLGSSFHYGPAVVGLFGIIGVVGAVAASASGKLADLKGPRFAQQVSFIVTLLSFILFCFSAHSIVLLVIGVIVMDAGVQATHIACQADVFSMNPEARSRLNGIYMFFRFSGGALGSMSGAWTWNHFGWTGVCLTGVVLSLLSFAPFIGQPKRVYQRATS